MTVPLIQTESPSLGTGARTGSWIAGRWVHARRPALSDRTTQWPDYSASAPAARRLRTRVSGRWWSCPLRV